MNMFVFYRTVVCFSHLPKIRKAGNSDKRKSHFRLGYAEPCPIFAVTNIGIIVVCLPKYLLFEMEYAVDYSIFDLIL